MASGGSSFTSYGYWLMNLFYWVIVCFMYIHAPLNTEQWRVSDLSSPRSFFVNLNRILTNLALLLPLFLFFCLYCFALRSLDTSVLIPSVSCALSALSQSFALLNSLFNAFSSFKTTFPLLHSVISLNGKASPTNQSAHQADGSSPLTVVGETISCFSSDFHLFLGRTNDWESGCWCSR